MTKALVVGYGLAGGLAAIQLHDIGCDVTVIEKMPMPGGISITSGGGIRASVDAKKTLEYLKISNEDTVPIDILENFSVSMTKIPNTLKKLAAINNSTVTVVPTLSVSGDAQHYGWSGYESFVSLSITDTPGVDVKAKYPSVVNGRGLSGLGLFEVVDQNVQQRGIDVKYNTSLTRLIKDSEKVIGVNTTNGEMLADVVVLACGGFENSPDMKINYWQGKPVHHNGFTGNTGDGIRAAQAVGADLWHMWHYHGTYGFLHPDGFGVRLKGGECWNPQDPQLELHKPFRHIVVDKNGRRFMNEHPPYLTDHGHRPMEIWSPEETRYPRIPAYFISDEKGRLEGPWGSYRLNMPGADYDWSDNNTKEIAQGIVTKCNTVEQLAQYIGCDANILEQTLLHYNQKVCVEGDKLYHRPDVSCVPIENPPYYVAEMWPIVSNTQGGPRRNRHFQVVDPFGNPIKGLYSSGECGSIWGHVYLSSGNLSECFVGADLISNHVSQNYH
jgi:succinate dehydrogenase/fumarate reductase flavoprotein subunit